MPAILCYIHLAFRLLIAAISVALVPACKTIESDAETSGMIDQPTFALIDLDKDGKVSPSEIAKYKHEEGLSELDLDDDRQISKTEWVAAKPSSATNDQSFARLDLDKDGKVIEAEAISSITADAAFLEAFKIMDANGDGFLHWEEYTGGDPMSLDISLISAAPAPVETPAAPSPTVQ